MIVVTRPDWLRVVEKLKASRDANGIHVFSADTETVDCGYPDIHITSFSLAWYEGFDENGVARFDGAYVPVGHHTGELQLSRADVYPELKALMEDPAIEVVFHNAKYDVNVLTLFTAEPHDPVPFSVERLLKRGRPKGVGIFVNENIFDTFIAHFLLNTNGAGTPAQVMAGKGHHGLKDLSYYLLGYKMTELADLAKTEKYMSGGVEHETLRTDLVPIHDVVVDGIVKVQGLGGYAWDDAVQTLKLRDRFKVQLIAEPATERIYRTIHREFTFVLGEMEQFGVELDVELLGGMRDAVAKELLEIGERMYSQRPGQNFDRILDTKLIEHVCVAYDDLDRRFGLPLDNPEYPKKLVKKGEGRGKARRTWEELAPAHKGSVRKELFVAHGLAGHPVEAMIRDDKMRPKLKTFPHLAHKLFNIASNNQLNDVLFTECGLSPIGERGADDLWSTKAEYIDIWAALRADGSFGPVGHPMAQELSRFREIDKLYGTYLVGMVALLASDDRLRTRFNQSGARTGRLSSAEPNLQNIPTSSEFPIRRAFVATGVLVCNVEVLEWVVDDKGKNLRPKRLICTAMPGNARGFDGGYELNEGWVVRWWGSKPPWCLFVGDYSQLEIALLAHVSGDKTLIDAVTNKVDIHAMTAQACFDDVPKDISLADVKKNYKKRRGDAKPISFGIIYGMGPGSLSKNIGVTPEEAKIIIDERYLVRYPGVKTYIDGSHAFAKVNGYVATAVGRRRHLPAAQIEKLPWKPLPKDDPYTKERDRRNALVSSAMRQAQNTPIQGFAADLVALAMRELRRHFRRVTWQLAHSQGDVLVGQNGELPGVVGPMWGTTMRCLVQVHDELIQEFHPAVANYGRKESVRLMESAGGVKLRVPLRVDAALGTNWLDSKE